MKILILSCNTGEGHNSAAKAIREYFLSNNDECDIKDAPVKQLWRLHFCVAMK